jgi:hypothetical protein
MGTWKSVLRLLAMTAIILSQLCLSSMTVKAQTNEAEEMETLTKTLYADFADYTQRVVKSARKMAQYVADDEHPLLDLRRMFETSEQLIAFLSDIARIRSLLQQEGQTDKGTAEVVAAVNGDFAELRADYYEMNERWERRV